MGLGGAHRTLWGGKNQQSCGCLQNRGNGFLLVGGGVWCARRESVGLKKSCGCGVWGGVGRVWNLQNHPWEQHDYNLVQKTD